MKNENSTTNFDWIDGILRIMPDLLSFIVQVAVLAILFYAAAAGMLTALMEQLPQFCNVYEITTQ